jgi:hypothetical protein
MTGVKATQQTAAGISHKMKSYKEKDTEKTRGKKRFIERQVEDLEAEQEIKHYKQELENNPDNDKEPTID